MENKYLEALKDFEAFGERAECQKHAMTLENLDVMQINVGRRCNLSCTHCHLNGGINRMEIMSQEVMKSCIEVFENKHFKTLDITGGAPEMNPDFRWLIETASEKGIHTIVRTNLAILLEEGYEHFSEVYARNKVELVASLPCYTENDTDKQRGSGVFEACISVMKNLNSLGYGKSSELVLNLVYNPGGAFLPPKQSSLSEDYRKKLFDQHGISFNNLYTITNSPIGKFGDFLERSGDLTDYMNKLISAYNPLAVGNMMCRNQISIDWDGTTYDCDFNLALGLTSNISRRIQDLEDAILSRKIVFGNHCYACTAGAGSSCKGVTA